ncbi:MAG: aldolase [Acidobacteriota bacterium]|nr:aldolase [Acidobacteriota bacterium]
MTNALADLLRAGGQGVGSWCSTRDPFTVEVLTTDGVDFVCIDCQHGLADRASLPSLLPAVRGAVTPLVRVASDDPAEIGRALDLGAGGVIVPMVETAAQAVTAVAACRYPPRGNRSYGPTRAGLTLGTDPGTLDSHPLCFVMIETPAGVDNAAAICRVDGLGGVYIGPADLAIGLGISPAAMLGDRRHEEAVGTVLEACRAEGRFAGIHTTGGADAATRLAVGFHLVSLPTDVTLLRAAVKRELAVARGADGALPPLRPYG